MKIPPTIVLRGLLSAGLLATAVNIAVARISDDTSSAPSVPTGWRVLSVPGKPATHFSAAAAGAIKVSARDSAGFLYRRVAAGDPTRRYLVWRWRVDMSPPPTDQSMPGMDDRPLAVHVWFDGQPGDASPWTLLDRIGAWLSDTPLPGKVLTYVWGGTGKRGDSIANPYLPRDGRLIILRAGAAPTGRWFSESVDVAADFRKAFGYPAPRPRFVAISADTDDKRGDSMGVVAGLDFRTRP